MWQSPSVRQRLASGKQQFGLFMNTCSPVVTEIAARAGFDVLLFDHEHGPGTVQDAIACMNATRGSNAECWVRVPNNDPVYPKNYLDAGADGIMCPMVSTAEEARRFVSYCQYPPHGIRGLAPAATRHSNFGYARDEYLKRVKDDLTILIQIETREAVENVEAIAAIDGVDVLFLGPIDLSASLGVFGEFNNPILLNAMTRIEAAARKAKKPLATLYMPGMDVKNLVERGYTMLIGGGDIGVIRTGMQGTMAMLQKAAAEAQRKG